MRTMNAHTGMPKTGSMPPGYPREVTRFATVYVHPDDPSSDDELARVFARQIERVGLTVRVRRDPRIVGREVLLVLDGGAQPD